MSKNKKYLTNNEKGFAQKRLSLSITELLSQMRFLSSAITNVVFKVALLFILSLVPQILYAVDTDNDGITNSNDLDDDNDGILDTVEKMCIGTPVPADVGFVQEVIAYRPLAPLPPSNVSDPNQVLGAPDSDGDYLDQPTEEFTALGGIGSELLLGFVNSALVNSGTNAGDIKMIELGQAEVAEVRLLPTPATKILIEAQSHVADSEGYFPIGNINGSTPFDIDATFTGFAHGDLEFTAIKFVAINNAGAPNYGPDIDAVQALSYNAVVMCDTDNDGLYDHLDIDSDNDGIPDNIEAQTTQHYQAPSGTVDANGTYSAIYGANGITPVDTDEDNVTDMLDLDSDDDTIFDIIESGQTIANDGNGRTTDPVGANGLANTVESTDDYSDVNGDVNDPINYLKNNTDNDLTQSDYRSVDLLDTDNDEIPDNVDLDDDNDGILDAVEYQCVNSNIKSLDFGTTAPAENMTPIASGVGTAFSWGDFDATVTQLAGSINHGIGFPGGPGSSVRVDFSKTVYNLDFQVTDMDVGEVVDLRFYDESGVLIDILPYVIFQTTNQIVQAQAGQSARAIDGNQVSGGDYVNYSRLHILEGVSYFEADFVTRNAGGGPGIYVANACTFKDTDGDSIPDHLDLDSDSDGISDLIESGQDFTTVDTDNDGQLDSTTDADSDGVMDVADADDTDAASAGTVTPINSDSDSLPDYVDLDADNDGIPDAVEAQLTNTYVSATFVNNATNNGVNDNGLFIPVNTDGVDTPDYIDTDSDNDSAGNDTAESGITPGADGDGDGIGDGMNASYADPDGDINTPNSDLDNEIGDTTEVGYREAPPLAVDDSYSVAEDGTVTLTPSTGDSDPDGTFTLTSINGTPIPALGTTASISVNDGTVNIDAAGVITFTSDANYNGPVSFLYVITDDDGLTATANENITVTDVNDAPVAVDDAYTTAEDAPVTLTPLTGDSDVDGTFTLTSINGSAIPALGTTASILVSNGTVNIDAAGVITFTPDPDYNGSVSILYVITDDDGSTATANENITVTDVNDAPVSVDDTGSITTQDLNITVPTVGGNDTDSDGTPDVTTIILIDPNDAANTGSTGTPLVIPNVGTYIVDVNGNVTFDPLPAFTGTADIKYTIEDDDGLVSDNQGTIGIEVQADTDGDGIPDVDDLDDDNDGILDTVEAATATNGGDTDGDGIPDSLDLDSDGDGILDLAESNADPLTVDADNDGVLDSITDADNDGVMDTADADDNNPVSAGSVTPIDTDGDGLPDFQDIDSDNDGLSDLVEGGSDPTLDTDNNGVLDVLTDTDGDGIADSIDPDNGGTAASVPDTDADSVPNYRDLDSDNDGLNDVTEAGGIDVNEDGLDDTPNASFADGTTDTVDGGNNTPDVLEPNNPNLAGILDPDGNGVIDGAAGNPDAATDTDGDGIPDVVDATPNTFADGAEIDTDNDGIPDVYDIDDDNDGIPDVVEENGITGRDTDGDGVPDSKDLDADNDGILDIEEAGGNDIDHNGQVDGLIDTDNDGLADVADANPTTTDAPTEITAGIAATNLPITNTDSVDSPDFQALDSDGDGINDLIEAGVDATANDTNSDGMIDTAPDSDANGILEGVNTNGIATVLDPATGGQATITLDNDGDGAPDFQDLDSDGDGTPDAQDGSTTTPVATNDSAAAYLGSTTTISLLNNDDFIPSADTILTNTGNGTAQGQTTFNPLTGEMTYTPAQTEVGEVTVEYEVCNTGTNPVVCSTAIVTITVSAAATKVPTLSEWMMILMSMLLGSIGLKESHKIQKRGKKF